MATFIKVTQEGSELLRRNVEQTQANRLAKLEGDEQRKKEQQAREARQQALQQQGRNANGDVQGGGRRRGQFRRDEPAASFLPQTTGISQVWFTSSGGSLTSPSLWRVFCGDGSQNIDGSREIITSFSRMLLPAGGSNGILIVQSRTDPGFSLEGVYGEPLDRAYICNQTKIRQINIPPALAAVLAVLNPPAGPFVDTTSFIPDGVNTSSFPPRQLTPELEGGYDPLTGWADPFFSREWSPRAFQLLNIIQPYANNSVFKPYSQDYPLYYDRSQGLHESLLSSDKAFYYAKYLGDPSNVTEDPTLFQGVPKLTVRPRIWPPANSLFPYELDGNGNPQISAELLVAWDWDDPAYCRQMLTLLGFSASDLTP